jgi:hypothetical protein
MQESPPQQDLLKEIFRLERDNNQILHSMRRSAFMWGIIKFILYAGFLLAPVWFYMTYLSGTLDTMINTMNKLQGGAESTQQFEGFQDTLQQLKYRLPSFLQQQEAKATTPTSAQ